MDGLEELATIMSKIGDEMSSVQNWYQEHKDDPIFSTELGEKLMDHLGGMIKQQTLGYLVIVMISCKEAAEKFKIMAQEQELIERLNEEL